MAGPVIIIVSNHIIDKWVREKVMVGVEHSVALVGFLAFLVTGEPKIRAYIQKCKLIIPCW